MNPCATGVQDEKSVVLHSPPKDVEPPTYTYGSSTKTLFRAYPGPEFPTNVAASVVYHSPPAPAGLTPTALVPDALTKTAPIETDTRLNVRPSGDVKAE